MILSKVLGLKTINLLSDSELLVTQVKGTALCWDNVLKQLLEWIHEFVFQFDEINLNYIEREYNFVADYLSE